MAAYLLDTNVVSESMRVEPDRRLDSRVRMHEAICVMAAPSIEELAFGIARLPASDRRDFLQRALDGALERFIVLPYDTAAALWLGREQARLAAIGRPLARIDGQIAAIAVINNLTLITRDRDFGRFADLRTENWFAR